MTEERDSQVKPPEEEHKGSLWTHPYMIYILLTAFLFGVLCFIAWLALTNGWIPNRGIPAS